MWPLSLISGNVKLIAYGAAVLAIAWGGSHLRGMWDDAKLQRELGAQETALIAKCDADKKITEDVGREYETKISALNRRIAALRVQPSSCLPVTSTATGRNGSTTGTINAGAHGISSEFLIDYAGEAEKYRLQLISCQDFIQRERHAP